MLAILMGSKYRPRHREGTGTAIVPRKQPDIAEVNDRLKWERVGGEQEAP